MTIDKMIIVNSADGIQKELSGDEFVKAANFGISFIPTINRVGFVGFNDLC